MTKVDLIEVPVYDVDLHTYRDMRTWCLSTFGKEAWSWVELESRTDRKWFSMGSQVRDAYQNKRLYGDARFGFNDGSCATAFILRWK